MLSAIAQSLLHLSSVTTSVIERSPSNECLLICTNLLTYLLTQQTPSPPLTATVSGISEEVVAEGEEGTGACLTAAEALGSLEQSSLRSKCMDVCLNIVETYSSQFRRCCDLSGEENEVRLFSMPSSLLLVQLYQSVE